MIGINRIRINTIGINAIGFTHQARASTGEPVNPGSYPVNLVANGFYENGSIRNGVEHLCLRYIGVVIDNRSYAAVYVQSFQDTCDR